MSEQNMPPASGLYITVIASTGVPAWPYEWQPKREGDSPSTSDVLEAGRLIPFEDFLYGEFDFDAYGLGALGPKQIQAWHEVGEPAPRFSKKSCRALRRMFNNAEVGGPFTHYIAFDFDNRRHVEWRDYAPEIYSTITVEDLNSQDPKTRESLDRAGTEIAAAALRRVMELVPEELRGGLLGYTTRRGIRIMWVLDRPIHALRVEKLSRAMGAVLMEALDADVRPPGESWAHASSLVFSDVFDGLDEVSFRWAQPFRAPHTRRRLQNGEVLEYKGEVVWPNSEGRFDYAVFAAAHHIVMPSVEEISRIGHDNSGWASSDADFHRTTYALPPSDPDDVKEHEVFLDRLDSCAPLMAIYPWAVESKWWNSDGEEISAEVVGLPSYDEIIAAMARVAAKGSIDDPVLLMELFWPAVRRKCMTGDYWRGLSNYVGWVAGREADNAEWRNLLDRRNAQNEKSEHPPAPSEEELDYAVLEEHIKPTYLAALRKGGPLAKRVDRLDDATVEVAEALVEAFQGDTTKAYQYIADSVEAGLLKDGPDREVVWHVMKTKASKLRYVEDKKEKKALVAKILESPEDIKAWVNDNPPYLMYSTGTKGGEVVYSRVEDNIYEPEPVRTTLVTYFEDEVLPKLPFTVGPETMATPERLLATFARNVTTLHRSYRTQEPVATYRDPKSGRRRRWTLQLPLYGVGKPTVKWKPEFDLDCAGFLDALFGEHSEIGLDWLATFTNLGTNSPMLALVGESKAGKDVLATALTRLSNRTNIPFQDAVKQFVNLLQDTWFIYAQEGLDPDGISPGAMLNKLRVMVTEKTHTVELKNQPVFQFETALRVMVTANSDKKLNMKGIANSAEAKSIQRRVIYIPVTKEAVKYISALSRKVTSEGLVWEDYMYGKGLEPGVLVRHIQWLTENRAEAIAEKIKNGPYNEGSVPCANYTQWHRSLINQSPRLTLLQSILDVTKKNRGSQHLYDVVFEDKKVEAEVREILAKRTEHLRDGVLYLSHSQVHKTYVENMDRRDTRPKEFEMKERLQELDEAVQYKRVRITLPGEEYRRTLFGVPLRVLLDAGVASEEDLLEVVERVFGRAEDDKSEDGEAPPANVVPLVSSQGKKQ